MADLFLELGVIIILATMLAYIAKLFRQPFIQAYIFAGLILGPILGIITSSETITILSEIGIAFLLFIAGLELDFSRLRNVGLVSSLGGSLQVIFLFVIGYAVGTLFGFGTIPSVYIGLILSFSSTMVIIKLLSDHHELDTLHGRIVIGMLLMEDVLAILALTVLTTLNDFSSNILILALLKGSSLIFLAYLCSKYLFPRLFKTTAESQELLFLGSLTVCFIFALMFSLIGFSVAIGAFIAGVALANLPYYSEIIGKIVPLKDFFATIFFVSLGLQIVLADLSSILVPSIILILVILLVKPLLRMITASFFGYMKRPSFLTAITMTQISEFSLIIAAQGLALGHISTKIVSLTTIVAIVTIASTSYFVKFKESLFNRFSKTLSIFEKLNLTNHHLEYIPVKRKSHEVILCGYNRIGYSIVKTYNKNKEKLLVVDFNPEVIRELIKNNVPCIYGDAGDLEIIDRMNPKKAKMLISTIPNLTTNILLLQKFKSNNKKIFIIVTASQVDEALKLYSKGADYVILPHLIGGYHISNVIKKVNRGQFNVESKRRSEIEELRERQNLGHDHNLKLHR